MSEAAPCWVTRQEADPRYDYSADTFDNDAPGMAPHCTHPGCLAEIALHERSTVERDECTGVSMWDCPITVCRWDAIHAMCDLDHGHDGDHQYVNEDEITLVFVNPAATAGGAS